MLTHRMFFRLLGLVFFCSTAFVAAGDVLVVAPHPDDEAIGCAGVIMRALAEKKRVAVVVLTNGDGHVELTAAVAKKDKEQLTPEDFMKAGALRQGHSVKAMKRLGVPRDDLFFLGYPDGGLEKMWLLDGSSVFRQKLTHKDETYGLVERDYHSLTHGSPAPYLKASAVADLAAIIRARKPDEIYVSHESDKHKDHSTAFGLAREAARMAEFQGHLFAFVVHGVPLSRDADLRLELTPQEYETKKAALIDHTKGTSPVHDGLVQEYLKPQEQFWQFPIK